MTNAAGRNSLGKNAQTKKVAECPGGTDPSLIFRRKLGEFETRGRSASTFNDILLSKHE
jgi:hypothetical protein